MNIQNNDITLATSIIVYDILSRTNFIILTADMILLCTKNPVPNSCFSFPFPQKNVHSPAGSVPPPLHLTTYTPSKSKLYFEISFATSLSEPALYILLIFQVHQISYIFSFA
jgi:hypothetical protein